MLPDLLTCGGLCPEFPDCLPTPSPELIASIVGLRESQAREHEYHWASAQALRILQQAIDERIDRD